MRLPCSHLIAFGAILALSFLSAAPSFDIQPLPLQPCDSPVNRQAVNLSQLIDGLQNKYARMQGLAADFLQVYAGPDGHSASESGRLALKRPGKARWEY